MKPARWWCGGCILTTWGRYARCFSRVAAVRRRGVHLHDGVVGGHDWSTVMDWRVGLLAWSQGRRRPAGGYAGPRAKETYEVERSGPVCFLIISPSFSLFLFHIHINQTYMYVGLAGRAPAEMPSKDVNSSADTLPCPACRCLLPQRQLSYRLASIDIILTCFSLSRVQSCLGFQNERASQEPKRQRKKKKRNSKVQKQG